MLFAIEVHKKEPQQKARLDEVLLLLDEMIQDYQAQAINQIL